MALSNQQIISNGGSASDVAVAISGLRDEDGVGVGHMIADLITPAFRTRTGLTSSDTHVEDKPGLVLAVMNEAGSATLALVYDSGGAGAGEVQVTYSAGVPTLVFGDGANTGYQILKVEGPSDAAASLATIFLS